MFTNQHYEAIAAVLYNSSHLKACVIRNLCTMFEADNPNFDRERFIAVSDIDGDM